MPAASSKPTPQNAPQGATDFPSQLMAIMEKKMRNLEKRKVKLQQYRDMVKDGQELTKDQVQAASHFDEVVSNLEFAKELHKTFTVTMSETTKVSKKQVKRENALKHEQELRKIQDVILLNSILNTLGMDHIRNDFLEGKNGAVKLTEDQVNHLDEFYKLINPAREDEEETEGKEVSFETKVTAASEHLNSYIKEDEKEVLGTTYKALKEMVTQINGCGYLDNLPTEPTEEEVEEIEEEPTQDPDPSSAPVEETPEDDFVVIQQDQVPPPEAPEVTSSLPPVVIPPTPEEPPMSRVQQPVDHAFPKPIEMPPHKVKGHGSDILASVQQGSFNFMQDSMLEYENSPHMDPAVVSVSQSYLPPQGYNALNHQQAEQSMQQRQSLDQLNQPQTMDMPLSDPSHPSQLPTHPAYDTQSGMVSDPGYQMQSPYETQQSNMVQPQSHGHQHGQLPGQSLGQSSSLGAQAGHGGQQRGHSTQPGQQTIDGLSQSQTILSTQHQQISDLPEFPSPPGDAQHSSAEDKSSSLQASMLGQQSSMSSMGSGPSYSQSLSSQNLSGQSQMSSDPNSQHTSQMGNSSSHTEHPSASMQQQQQHHSGDMSSSSGHPNGQQGNNNPLAQKSTMNASAPPFQMTNSTRSSPQMQAMQQSAIDQSQTEMGTFQSTDSTPQAEKTSERDSGSPKAETAASKSPQGEQADSMEQPSDNQSSNSTGPSSYPSYQSSYSNTYQPRGGNGRGNPRGGRGNITNTSYRGNRGGMSYMGGRGGGRYPPANPNQSPRGGYNSYLPRDNFQQRAQDMPFGNSSQNYNTFNRPQDPNYGGYNNRRVTTQRGAPRGARGGPGGVRGQSNFRGRGGSTGFKPQSSQLTV
ncbi:uncharacterized protein [Asterias amurensis]|uniref:uncharacterized protein n=1 Tax=Asterias amurensis TaxID=7602 RepID=UPI003AB83307